MADKVDLAEIAPIKRAPLLATGLGLMAGGFEAIKLSATLKLSMTFTQGLALALSSVVLNGALAFGLGLVAGTVIQLLTGRWLPYRRHAMSMAVTAWLMGVWFLLPVALDLYEQGRQPASVAFAMTPFGIAGVIWFNALFWLKREYVEGSSKLGWWFYSAVGALLLSVTSGIWLSQRNLSTVSAIATDPDVLIVTIDTLRRDHLSAYEADPFGAGVPVQTPVFDGLAAEGILYTNAITPMPETLPAHSAMFTGLHPVRSKVLSNGHTLSSGHTTLAEVLSEEGYATGAFVSSFAVDSRTGIDQGFQVFDDDFFPWVRGFTEIRVASIGTKVLMRIADPTDFPFLLERTAPVTIGRAVDWMTLNDDRPALAWVHLFEPHSPYEPHGLPGFEDNGTPDNPSIDHRDILSNEASFTYTDEVRSKLRRLYAEEVAYTDQMLGELIASVRAMPSERPLLLIVTADHGEMLGEHGIEMNHHGIYDEAIQVPLLIVPVRFSEMKRVVDDQVRLMDITATVLKQLRLDSLKNTESGELIKFAELPHQRGYNSLLIGRKTASLAEGTQFGYRARNQDGGGTIKYIWTPDSDEELLFDISADPRELENIIDKQPTAAQVIREQVQAEVGDLSQYGVNAEVDASTEAALRALGYVE
ncbi:MAG: choline-sulfatase [Myxococcota bacterium]|jgi:choline-sulfatase